MSRRGRTWSGCTSSARSGALLLKSHSEEARRPSIACGTQLLGSVSLAASRACKPAAAAGTAPWATTAAGFPLGVHSVSSTLLYIRGLHRIAQLMGAVWSHREQQRQERIAKEGFDRFAPQQNDAAVAKT